MKPIDEVRALAIDQNDFHSAIELMEHYLASDPDNSDFKNMLINLYKWNKNYNAAMLYVDEFINQDPGSRNFLTQKINILEEMGLFENSLVSLNYCLNIFQEDEYFLFRKAYCLSKLNRIEESISLLTMIVDNYPKNTDAEYLLEQLKASQSKNIFGFGYNSLIGARDQSSIHFYNLTYGRKFKKHSFIATVNSSRWNQKPGFEFSISNYYKISDTDYSMLGFSYSQSEFFPNYRLTGAYHRSFKTFYQASLTTNILFTDLGNLSIISPSLSRIYKRWGLTGVLLVLSKPESLELLYTVKLSKEFGTKTNKLSLIYGSLSSDEIISLNQFDRRQGNFLGLELRLYKSLNSSVSLNYLKNLDNELNFRDRISCAVQHSF